MRIGHGGWVTLGCALLGWLACLLTVLGVPPSASAGQPVFYGSLLLALTASGALVGAIGARRREPRRPTRSAVAFLPHSLLASFLLLFALWLQSLRALAWPNALLLLGLFVLLEGAYSLASRRYWTD
jgi:phosphoglycerol transferase MdoB-like AlkP superfamily enzyme